MTDWLEELPETVEAEVVEVVPKTRKELALAELGKMEDRIFEKASKKVFDGLHYDEIDPESDTPPQKWVDELGFEAAMERFRTAKYNLLPAKDAPVGAKHAVMIHASITKARAQEKGGNYTLNVGKVYLTAPPVFPEKELEEGE